MSEGKKSRSRQPATTDDDALVKVQILRGYSTATEHFHRGDVLELPSQRDGELVAMGAAKRLPLPTEVASEPVADQQEPPQEL